MAVPRKRAREEDIIVISSDEDEAPHANLRARRKRPRREARREVQEVRPHPPQATSPAPLLPPLGQNDDLLPHDNAFFIIDDEPLDYSQIPRVDQPLQLAGSDTCSDEAIPSHMNAAKPAVDVCVDTCADLFPGISHDHVRQLFVEHQSDIQQVTNAILESSNYPKEKEDKPITTMAAPVIEDFARPGRPPLARASAKAVVEVLRSEFPEMPTTYITSTLNSKQQLYSTYLALDEARRQAIRPYRAHRQARAPVDVFGIITALGGEPAPIMRAELGAARDACKKAASERANFEQCKRQGTLQECSVCFDELPYNRTVACSATHTTHFTCYDCTKTYIGSEVGQGTCNVTCPYGIDGQPCGSAFSEAALRAIDDARLLKKLFTLKQQQEIRQAGLGDLAECPFCDYKEIYPKIEDNFEFQCQNPECMILSCRRCSKQSHIPSTCQENSKDDALAKRHKIEEAMTAALVRTCNKCQQKFVKEYGCNKMTCNCGNTQCYVCGGKTVDYKHFNQNPLHSNAPKDPNKCPLYDDLETRHREDVEKAEKEAREAVQKEFPNIAAEDLEIKMAEAVRNEPAKTDRAPMPAMGQNEERARMAAIRAQELQVLLAQRRGEEEARMAARLRLNAMHRPRAAADPDIAAVAAQAPVAAPQEHDQRQAQRDGNGPAQGPPLPVDYPFGFEGHDLLGFDGVNERPVPYGNPFAGHSQNFVEAARAYQVFGRPAQPQFVQAPAGNFDARIQELRRIQQRQQQELRRVQQMQQQVRDIEAAARNRGVTYVQGNPQDQAPAQVQDPQQEPLPDPQNMPVLDRVARRIMAGRQMLAARANRAAPNAEAPRRQGAQHQLAQIEARFAARVQRMRDANALAPADPAVGGTPQQALGPDQGTLAAMENTARAMQGVEVRIPPYPRVGAQPRQR